MNTNSKSKKSFKNNTIPRIKILKFTKINFCKKKLILI